MDCLYVDLRRVGDYTLDYIGDPTDRWAYEIDEGGVEGIGSAACFVQNLISKGHHVTAVSIDSNHKVKNFQPIISPRWKIDNSPVVDRDPINANWPLSLNQVNSFTTMTTGQVEIMKNMPWYFARRIPYYSKVYIRGHCRSHHGKIGGYKPEKS